MDLSKYRQSESEQERSDDLMRLIPQKGHKALDVGARDGHFSALLTDYYEKVTALDLHNSPISNENVDFIQGDMTNLCFLDNSFDLVFCAEVLEHIPSHLLQSACAELGRVSREYILIGVPYKQDIRVGRTTCYSCGETNPPWGHVNSFDEIKIRYLFPSFKVILVSFVGEQRSYTNAISSLLMDWAGNPFGTYDQEEECVHCGEKLKKPPERTFSKKLLSKASEYGRYMQKPFFRSHPIWIHVLLKTV